MPETRPSLLDLSSDLTHAAGLGTTIEHVDELLGESIEKLGQLIPFDLATIMELDGDELWVRVARGRLANAQVLRHRLRLSDFGRIREILERNRTRAFTEADHLSGEGDPFDGVLNLPAGHSCMVVPLRVNGDALGVMTFDCERCRPYDEAAVQLADIFGKLLAMAMSHGQQSAVLARVRDQLREHNRLLRERVVGRGDAGSLLEVNRSPAMIELVQLAKQVATTDAPVLITGETGTGKEVLANAIHNWGPRADQLFVSINCAALPANLIESELFGHVKGAFTGATKTRIGRFQTANGGTLLLDEVGDLPLELQPKLLRALNDGCFEPVGSDRTVRVDVRIIAATNADLSAAVAEKRFREDLYYRLAVFPLRVPALRDRPEDIGVIAENFLAALARRTARGPWNISEEGKRLLAAQAWPGNVRELINALERATILSRGTEIDLSVLGAGSLAPSNGMVHVNTNTFTTLQDMERHHIEDALRQTSGKLYGPGGAGDLLGIHPSTLRSRMKKLGLGGARAFRASNA
jgi:formate hydrogenlyase transcriptional activator